MLPFKKILAPTDFSSASLVALGRAAELARHFDAQLCINHIIEPVPPLPPDFDYGLEVPRYQPNLQSNAEERLREVIDRHVPPGLKTQTRIRHGEAAQEIVRTAEEEGADLIVIATHGLTGWRHLVFGSVTEKVVRMAGCPVLTLRVEEPAAGEPA